MSGRACLLVAMSLVAALAFGTATVSSAESTILICLDTGHGGSEPGAVFDQGGGADELREADVNLDVARGLETMLLETDGIDVTMTRVENSNKSIRSRYEWCTSEKADLLVSVHTNGSTNSGVDGSMAIYFHNDDKVLAEAILGKVHPALREHAPDPGAFLNRGVKKDALGVVLKTKMPGAVIEPLFMSHAGGGGAEAYD